MSRRPSRRSRSRKKGGGSGAASRPAPPRPSAASGNRGAHGSKIRRPTAIAVLAAAAGLAGYWIWSASQPAGGSRAPLATVAVPTLEGAALEGEAAFETYCQRCHGQNAAGKDGFGPPLVHRLYVPGHHPDAAFISAAANGARAHHWGFGDMPPVDGISEPEIGLIVAYVRALQRANGIR